MTSLPGYSSNSSLSLNNSTHHQWLNRERTRLLDFYQPQICDSHGGFNYLDSQGHPLPEQGKQLWLGARMLHCFAMASMLGRPGAHEIAEHGLDYYLNGPGYDHEYGGWFATVGGNTPSIRKELYGQAHILLAASSAHHAGFTGAKTLIDTALHVIDTHYWDEKLGRCVESFDRTFTEADPYRGQNANMHLTEAFLAAYEATGYPHLLERAVRIARFIAGGAASDQIGAWRLNEHFNSNWEPLPDYNTDDPRHPFRPYGSQPGHWLEWSKLIMQMKGLGVDEAWLIPAAVHLYEGAMTEGWQSPGGGFVYTVDWHGNPVVHERFFWEPAEAIGAAYFLYLNLHEERYAQDYEKIWHYITTRVADMEHGSWFHELNESNQPVSLTWEGKPDLYHAFQATMYAFLPKDLGLAAWASTQAQH